MQLSKPQVQISSVYTYMKKYISKDGKKGVIDKISQAVEWFNKRYLSCGLSSIALYRVLHKQGQV